MGKKSKTTGKIVAYWTRRILVVLGSTLMLIVLILIMLAAFFEERIGRIVINEVNNNLKTELTVDQAELSLIWDFPNANVTLKNVEIKGVHYTDKPLLTAENLAFKFGIWGLFTSNYVVESVEVEKGSLYIVQGKKGDSFDVFKTTQSDGSTSSNALELSIEEAVFDDITFYYQDKRVQHEAKGTLDNAYFAGRFQRKDFDVESTAEIQMEYLRIDGSGRFLRNENVAYETIIDVDGGEKKYSIREIKIFVDGNSFAANGFWQEKDRGLLLNFNVESQTAQLQSILSLLPGELTERLGNFNSAADMFFNASIMGLYTATSQPGIDFSFGLKDGSLSHPDMPKSLEDVSFRAEFSNGEGRSNNTARFEISDFTAELDGQVLKMQLLVDNLDDPQVDFSLSGVAEMQALFRLMGEGFESGAGNLNINTVYLRGRYKDMLDSRRLKNVAMGGELSFRDIDLVYKGQHLYIPDGRIKLQENLLQVEELKMRLGESDVLISGQAKNILPVLLADSTNQQRAQLLFNFALVSEKLNLNEIRKLLPTSADTSGTAADSSLHIENYSQFLRGQLALRIEDFQYDFLMLNELRGELHFLPKILQIKGLKAKAMDGALEINSEMQLDDRLKLTAYVDLKQVDIQRVFRECKNFGQDVLTNENIHGKLTSLLKVEAAFDEYGRFLDEQLYAIMDILIEDGELINFEMLERFAKYVKLKDLQHINFSDLQNQLRIENKTVYIPAMFIRSNAANLLISGRHDFNQDMEYRIKVNASQALMNSFRRQNDDYTPLKAQQTGLFNVYAYISGNLYEDYEVKMGRRNVKRYLEAQLENETPELRNRLREAFSEEVQNLEEPAAWKDLPGLLE